ncbi:hypothetical protein BHM03_00056673 [Ensete ventricosum]|nr:hypothetical protein BHM03_00056673 [Ensete ventricosum]
MCSRSKSSSCKKPRFQTVTICRSFFAGGFAEEATEMGLFSFSNRSMIKSIPAEELVPDRKRPRRRADLAIHEKRPRVLKAGMGLRVIDWLGFEAREGEEKGVGKVDGKDMGEEEEGEGYEMAFAHRCD